MHSLICFDGGADVMFYSESPLGILAKVNTQFSGRLAVLKGDSLALQYQKRDPNALQIPLFHWYIKKLL